MLLVQHKPINCGDVTCCVKECYTGPSITMENGITRPTHWKGRQSYDRYRAEHIRSNNKQVKINKYWSGTAQHQQANRHTPDLAINDIVAPKLNPTKITSQICSMAIKLYSSTQTNRICHFRCGDTKYIWTGCSYIQPSSLEMVEIRMPTNGLYVTSPTIEIALELETDESPHSDHYLPPAPNSVQSWNRCRSGAGDRYESPCGG